MILSLFFVFFLLWAIVLYLISRFGRRYNTIVSCIIFYLFSLHFLSCQQNETRIQNAITYSYVFATVCRGFVVAAAAG